jgi:O-antigen biosynthesis protein
MSSKPYSIWTPDFEVTSGGIRVLYGLIGWLLAKGQIVIPNASGPEFITIYPEIVHGNPLGGQKVARYILATPGVMGMGDKPGPLEFDASESLWVFSQLYNTMGIDDDHIMFLPILDLHTFRITNTNKRTKSCKLVGKGQDLGLPQTEGLFDLNRQFSSNQQALADYLNECEVMYSYDPNSAMFEIARLCGCRVVVIPSRYTKEEFSKYEPGMNGISWGVEENVPLDAIEFRKHYQGLIKTFEERLEGFIHETQN